MNTGTGELKVPLGNRCRAVSSFFRILGAFDKLLIIEFSDVDINMIKLPSVCNSSFQRFSRVSHNRKEDY
jgi:hypothetical protein